MSQTYSLHIQSADCIVYKPGSGHKKSPNLYVTIDGAGARPDKTPVIRRSLKPEWNNFEALLSPESPSVPLTLRLCHDSRVPHLDKVLGECRITIEDLLCLCALSEAELDLKEKENPVGKLKVLLYPIEPETLLQNMQKDMEKMAPGDTTSRLNDLGEAAANIDLLTALNEVTPLLKNIIDFGGKLAQIHPYASAAWSILTAVYEGVKGQHEMDAKVVKLVLAMRDVCSFAKDVEYIAEIKSLETTVTAVTIQTWECAIFVREYTGHGNSSEHCHLLTTHPGRLVHNIYSNNTEKIDELCVRLLELQGSLQTGAAIQSAVLSAEIRDNIKDLVLETFKTGDFDASLRTECLLGTRQNTLTEITEWLTTPSGDSNVFWLYGVAGSGKCTISTTIANYFRDLGRLGAFIFFDRNKPGITASGVIHTIAYWLAKSNPHIKEALCKVITDEPAMMNASLQTQYQKFIQGPLLTARDSICGPIIILLDALDECLDKDLHSSLVSLIINDFPKLPAVFRFVITSRPDPDIAIAFGKQQHIRPFPLDISTKETKDDIVLYIKQYMEKVQIKHNLDNGWPGQQAIWQLTQYCDGLFIWASTAYKFIDRDSPRKKLKTLLDREFTPESRLDELYTIALESSADWSDSDFSQDALSVLGLVVLGRVPLTAEAMDSILGFEPDRSSKLLKDLGCVLQWGPGQTARMLHASFSDYLTDPKRCSTKDCGTHPWFIDRNSQTRSLTLRCFHILEHQLQFNICGLEDSHLLNSEVADLSMRIEKHLSPGLCYASQHWATHLSQTVIEDMICSKLHHFMENCFLHWLEVLSLVRQVGTGQGALRLAQKYVQPNNQDLGLVLVDGQRFIEGFVPVITQSVPHIYISGLAFAPKLSKVWQMFGEKFPYVLCYSRQSDGSWPNLLRSMHGHTRCVNSVAFSPDGSHIVSGSRDNTVRIWDSKTGADVSAPFTGHTERVTSVAFSPDGSHIVSGSYDNTVRIWDSKTGAEVSAPLTGHTNPVTSVAFSPDGSHIVSGSYDNTVRIWDSKTGAEVSAPFTGHTSCVTSVAFSPDGSHIVSGSYDNTVHIWDSKTGAEVSAPLTGHTNSVTSVGFSPDGSHIVSGSSDNTVRIWDSKTGTEVSAPFTGHTDSVTSVAFSPDGSHIVSGSYDNTVRIWDSKTGAEVSAPFTGHIEWVTSVAFSPDGSHIVSGSKDNTVCIWDSKTGAEVSAPLTGHTGSVTSVAFSPDGSYIVSGSYDHTVRIWDSKTGAEISASLTGHTNSVTSVAFSPDGSHIVSGSYDNTVRIWDSKTGAEVSAPLTGHTDSVTSVAFSPDGSHILSGSYDNTVRIWDSKTGAEVSAPFTGHIEWVTSVAFSPDGSHIVSGSKDNTVCIWDSKTGAEVSAPLTGHTGSVTSVAFSPDGSHIVSGSYDNTVRIWDSKTGTEVSAPFTGHTDSVTSVAFSPDGSHIVSGSDDNNLCIWDSKTGAEVSAPLTGHTNWVTSVAFSPDGSHIVSGSYDNTVRIWDSKTEIQPGPHSHISDGWVIDSHHHHLMWVPPWLRNDFCLPWNSFVISPHGVTKLDLSHFVHGLNWEKCHDKIDA
ncbi:WD40 repeat-like protein [Mycena albidolilacea]|uniref:WD40 repeat-like protein n=1 Tax=Mycena albidolilacea TaxID=1033008 RepID=A0AAD6Z4J0_9AGAR|nr:WD40 repeat-like protein [Mycena albidolilacea]